MEAQELLRKAADIYKKSDEYEYAPMALAKAAGMTPADTENLDITWDPRKPVRRSEHFFLEIAEFLDQCEADKNKPCDDITKQRAFVCAEFMQELYQRAIDAVAADASLAKLRLCEDVDLEDDSFTVVSTKLQTTMVINIGNRIVSSVLQIIAHIFDKEIADVLADVRCRQDPLRSYLGSVTIDERR